MLVDAGEEQRFARAVQAAHVLRAADEELTKLAVAVGEGIGLSDDELRDIRLVALLCDVGKRAIPAAMLQKAKPLTAVEWAVIQRHTVIGQRMLAAVADLEPAVEGVGAVRERWDGDGYPLGLSGEEIPISARVVQVCAAYSAMRAGRPGRPPRGHDDAVAELRACAGTQFDERVVDVACEVLMPEGPRPVARVRTS
jgi:two-component system cell cycle response regulator